jgi:hypothetical protein
MGLNMNTTLPVRHLKTGAVYYKLDRIINATNGCENTYVVLYQNKEGALFVRDEKEFWEKFAPILKENDNWK